MSAVLSETMVLSDADAAAQGVQVRHIAPPGGLQEAVVAAAMKLSLRCFFKTLVRPPFPIGMQRGVLHTLSVLMLPAAGTRVQHVQIDAGWGRMSAERVRPAGVARPERAILFLHGGAFCAGSPRSHRSITTRLAKLTGAEVLAPHYRRTPEAPFPAQIDDSVAAYRQLLADGWRPEQIACVGDSAGGTLTMLMPLALARAGLPLPAALVLISPAVELSPHSRSLHERAGRDPMISPSWGRQAMEWYAAPPEHPLARPLSQDFTRLPPTLVQVGTEEVLFDESLLFAREAAAHGARHVELEICDDRWHVFQIHAGLLPSADQALARQAAFLRRHWG